MVAPTVEFMHGSRSGLWADKVRAMARVSIMATFAVGVRCGNRHVPLNLTLTPTLTPTLTLTLTLTFMLTLAPTLTLNLNLTLTPFLTDPTVELQRDRGS